MRSTRWAFPAVSPWTNRRYGRPIALLSSRQHELHVLLRLTIRQGPRTLIRLAEATDNPSPGGVHRELRRLRQLELIGTFAKKGRRGRTYIWIPRTTRELARSLAGRRFPARNDSASTPSGTYLSAQWFVEAFKRGRIRYRGGAPPRTPLRRDGRRNVPRFLWGSCPIGHRVRLLRASFVLGPTAETLEGVWSADCPSCGRPASVHVMAAVPDPGPRELSVEERDDPARRSARVREAGHLLEAGGLTFAQATQVRRDYPELREP